ncbi:transcriptional regulator [Sporanaerobium hydrogeniformans]|uniref:Transcriptional regulator n=1 Tax=Sporanaerobium hydrogeniformans TaxID=3072179 RepID=A0AC61DEF2_9FIRM|nr:metalloregulator ArsR/SmtB family transcription factor [Sporanaerobium hydrogeniformans]PHV71270.1 transcriptional regulator [Sporanaerobium hydrogeniformans]
MKYSYSEYVPLLKALADETRLKIIDMLSCGELCACNILEKLNITQPTLSYHMKMLTQCELVSARKDGIWMKYKLNEAKVIAYKQFVEELLSHKEDCICKEKWEG